MAVVVEIDRLFVLGGFVRTGKPEEMLFSFPHIRVSLFNGLTKIFMG